MSPNKNFKLEVDDIEAIESALGYQIVRLFERRRTHIESTIIPESELDTVKEIDEEIRKINDLLGRIHNQKVWYRPNKGVYISG